MATTAVRRHLILDVILPDRPGAPGAVASRIGSVGANITDLTISRRTSIEVADRFHVNLPDCDLDLIELLRGELAEVDGVKILCWEPAHCCE